MFNSPNMSYKENRIVTSKYNKYTFFFVNMYHQLSKSSNLFFLITMILLTIPQISPFNPYTYLLAFCLVTGTSMVKDGVEDYKRHKQDKIMNTRLVNVVRSDNLTTDQVFVEDLKKGDFVFLKKNEDVPGDSILLVSKIRDKNGIKCKDYCFIDSSNLDGESNLKKKSSLSSHIVASCKNIDNPSEINSVTSCMCLSHFVKNITDPVVLDTGDVFTKYECTIVMDDRKYLCNEKNVLLKGMKLKNVESAVVYVVAVGKNTKLGKNNIMGRKRTSLFESELTVVVKLVFVLYFILLMSTSILAALFVKRNDIDYLYLNEYIASEAFKSTGTNYILFSYLIPLSLFVTLEVSRVFHALYISHDRNMTVDNVNSICRNSNVTEDLGMIEYILTDKTGTLTKNKMRFKKVHMNADTRIQDINTLKCAYTNDELKEAFSKLLFDNKKILLIFALLCCNSVEPLNNKYEGISQDEICIIQELETAGFSLVQRESSFVKIKINNILIKITIECVLDFSSSRQRMTVIVKIFDRFFLFSKGSDQMMLDEKQTKISHLSKKDLKKLINLNSFYRVLIASYKELSKQEVSDIKSRLQNISLATRSKDEDRIFKSIETDMEYIGTTFIEDELQDEVSETITLLKRANIKIWMITGDKKETALSCAVNCGLMNSIADPGIIAIEGSRFHQEIRNQDIFSYKSVILYRSTPKQKGEIALYFKKIRKNTLAVGDGNNDIPMLNAANVGVGILGKEGNQAGLSADFAIPNFKCLKYLILIHGRYNFIRFSKVTLNAFYKNVYLIIIQYFYNFFTGFSGKSVYNSYFLNYYNIFFTSLIPASISCFDKDASEEHIMEHPEEYRTAKVFFSKSIVMLILLYGLLQGVVAFLLVFGIMHVKDIVGHNGKVGGYNALNNLLSLVVFTTVFCGQIRLISFYNIFSYASIALSLLLYFILLFLFQDISFGDNVWILVSIPSFYFIFLTMFIIAHIMESISYNFFNAIIKKKTA